MQQEIERASSSTGGGSKGALPPILEEESASYSAKTLADEKFLRAMSTAAVRRVLSGGREEEEEEELKDEEGNVLYDSRTAASLSQSQSHSLKMSQSFISAQFASLSQEGSYQGFQEENEPVERQIFNEHTRCFGLLFRTWRVERIFLDGYARLHKNIVHLGFAVVFVAALLLFLGEQVRKHYNEFTCSKDQGVCDVIFDQMTTFIGGESIPWYYIPCFAGFSLAGSGMQWYVHRTDRIKEKSWAMLCTFLLYFVVCFGGAILVLRHDESGWPENFLMCTLAVYIVYIFFAGTTSFTPFLLLWIQGLVFFLVSYPIAKKLVVSKSGNYSQEYITLLSGYAVSLFWFLVLSMLFLVGAYLLEIASRKQFLRRILLHSQQNQIIKEKTKNEALQKKLLENIFPPFIVDQLQQQNFTVGTWDQLRALSHRHLGVSIMFAELENFTHFSSQVEPSHVMEYLNNMFQIFDSTCDDFDVYKVETVGDQYVAAVGVVTGRMLSENVSHKEDTSDSALSLSSRKEEELRESAAFNTVYMIDFAKAIIAGARHVVIPEQKEAETQIKPSLRVGIHTGSCMSGIVGNRTFRFCLFGDTMNTAARMEQTSVAECIHTTQACVDLAPDYSWEKLRKLDVKGKGLMQTYLLRVGRELDGTGGGGSDASAEANTNNSNAEVSFALTDNEYYNNPLFQTQGGGGGDASISILEGGSMANSKMGSGSTRYQDIPVLSRQVYMQHSKWIGLVFKKFVVEIAFYEGQAMLYKNVVYLGYILFVVVMLFNLLFGYILCGIINNTCQIPAYAETCLLTFGPEVLQRAQDPQDMQNSYSDIINQSLFRMTPAAGGVLAGLLVLGSASHYYIHKHFKHKSWALVNVFLFYGAILVTMYIFICTGVPDQLRLPTWIYSMGSMSMIVATLFIFFSGAPFTFYLVGVPIGAALYVGFTTPVILGAQDRTLEGSDIEYGKVVFASSVLLGVSIDLVIYCLLLILGSYLMDSTHRRTFLQRTLLVKQQEQIIKEKTKNESMQKLFLENILPSFLVGKLKEPRDARAGLSQRHVGVSMLFADLVGFTAFSSQVDPFKVMIFLNDLFQVFDSLCDQYNVYKVETVGDSYVAAVGVITGQLTDADGDTSVEVRREKASSNAKDAVGFAKAMIKGCRIVSKPEVNTPAIVRIGIHTGACISGIIGTRNLKFSLLGDVVVTAAHMEQLGRPDHIHASQQVVELTPEEPWEKHRVVNLRGNRRGKQCCIQTYLLA